jgi:hypothetical protein
MPDRALSLVTAAYLNVRLISQDARTLPQGAFYKSRYQTFSTFYKCMIIAS